MVDPQSCTTPLEDRRRLDTTNSATCRQNRRYMAGRRCTPGCRFGVFAAYSTPDFPDSPPLESHPGWLAAAHFHPQMGLTVSSRLTLTLVWLVLLRSQS